MDVLEYKNYASSWSRNIEYASSWSRNIKMIKNYPEEYKKA
jgi:hypothetical protein